MLPQLRAKDINVTILPFPHFTCLRENLAYSYLAIIVVSSFFIIFIHILFFLATNTFL
jgi:hypothetical protein